MKAIISGRLRQMLTTRLGAVMLFAMVLYSGVFAQQADGQMPAKPTTSQQLEDLTEAVARAQLQLQTSQQQLADLQRQLVALRQRIANGQSEQDSSEPALAESVEDVREQQSIQESQIATQAQSKVESESKYPVKLSGLILMNAFANNRAVDVAAAPTLVMAGPGSTGASLRQTILGLDARGPRLLGATSHADVRVDFFGSTVQGTYDAGGLARLRNAHAELDWKNTEAFVEYDRPIISPNSPTSLTAIAEPALAWSGNLWNWSPQVGVSNLVPVNTFTWLKTQFALISPPDPQVPGVVSSRSNSLAEQGRWPGTEARLAIAKSPDGTGAEIGAGGYFSPHRTPEGVRFNAWAGTLDFRVPLPARFELTGSFYRGQGLGGLGAGGFKDYVDPPSQIDLSTRALDDAGGWAQIKEKISPRIEFNADYGMDNVFAGELRPYVALVGNTTYQNLARNRTFFTNVIFSPSSYLLFSVEYRRMWTSPVSGAEASGNILGIAAGYKF
jgi:hypothetical protein